MKYSINKLKSIKNRFDARIDAEFYLPYYAKVDKTLNKHSCKNLAELTYKITDGTHYTPQYVTKGTPFLSAINVKENFLDLDCGYQYITSSEHNVLYKRCAPRAGDILLRKVGVGPRYATVVPNDIFEFSLFVSVALLKPKDINFYYLSTFINSKYGQIQLLRFNKGISQPDLHLEDIETLQVPILNNGFQKLIENIVRVSLENKKLIKELLNCSNELLLKELNLTNWQPKHKLYSIKKYSDVENVYRFDAEYFQPKYDEIIEKIKSYSNGWDYIGNLFNQNKKSFVLDNDVKYNYVEIGSVNTSNGEIMPEIILGRDLPANAKIKLFTGDVLVSNVRTYRGAVAIIESSDYIGSGAFTILQEKTESMINKETLYTFFKLKPILDLTLKYNTGTSYPTITDEDILNMPIPKFNQDVQAKIKENVHEYKKMQLQSKQLLEIAKRGVEIAIEQNEEFATKWINEQLLKLGINLN